MIRRLLLALILTLPMAASASGVNVTMRDGLLGVIADAASWPDVLAALEREARLTLHVTVPLEGPVTVAIAPASPERALKKLFGAGVDFVFVYGEDPRAPAGPVLTEVRVFAPGTGPAVASPAPPVEPHDSAALFDQVPAAALTSAQATDVTVRAEAVARLAGQTSPEAVRTLMTALDDSDQHVVQTALDALLPLAGRDPRVREALTRIAQSAADPDVRQLVGTALGMFNPPDDGGSP